MVYRTELETQIRNLVACDILSKPLSSLGQKTKRRRDGFAKEATQYITGDEEDERFFARVETREDEKAARTIREGIEEFKSQYPQHGKILEGYIQEKRVESNTFLVYGVETGFKLGAADYRRVMKDIGLNTMQADAMWPHLQDLSDKLGKAKETSERSILL